MNIFLESHKNLLERLIKANVKFLIIGGYAVNYYGYNRTTGDLDIWIKPDNFNKEKLIHVLEELGFSKDGLQTLKHQLGRDQVCSVPSCNNHMGVRDTGLPRQEARVRSPCSSR